MKKSDRNRRNSPRPSVRPPKAAERSSPPAAPPATTSTSRPVAENNRRGRCSAGSAFYVTLHRAPNPQPDPPSPAEVKHHENNKSIDKIQEIQFFHASLHG